MDRVGDGSDRLVSFSYRRCDLLSCVRNRPQCWSVGHFKCWTVGEYLVEPLQGYPGTKIGEVKEPEQGGLLGRTEGPPFTCPSEGPTSEVDRPQVTHLRPTTG